MSCARSQDAADKLSTLIVSSSIRHGIPHLCPLQRVFSHIQKRMLEYLDSTVLEGEAALYSIFFVHIDELRRRLNGKGRSFFIIDSENRATQACGQRGQQSKRIDV